MSRRRETWAWALALAWLALEPRAADRLGFHLPAPDLLVVLACVCLGQRRGGVGLAPWGWGLVRDALSGGPRGLHAIGYAVAVWAWRRAGRRTERSFAKAWVALGPAVVLALLPSALAWWLGGAPVAVVAGSVWVQVLATVLWAPAVLLCVGAGAAGGARVDRTWRGSVRAGEIALGRSAGATVGQA